MMLFQTDGLDVSNSEELLFAESCDQIKSQLIAADRNFNLREMNPEDNSVLSDDDNNRPDSLPSLLMIIDHVDTHLSELYLPYIPYLIATTREIEGNFNPNKSA